MLPVVVICNAAAPVDGFGVNVATAPVGRPVTDHVTAPLKPPFGVNDSE